MKITIIITFLLIAFSCSNKRLQDYDEVKKCYFEYSIEHKKSSLEKGYNFLMKNEDFKKNGITKENISLVYPIFLELKKYDELKNLLNENKSIPDYLKFYSLNYINALKLRCSNQYESNAFMRKNLVLIKSEMIRNPGDSSLYFDYYRTKLYVCELPLVYKEIDSLDKLNLFGKNFFNPILKEYVKDFSDEIVPCDSIN